MSLGFISIRGIMWSYGYYSIPSDPYCRIVPHRWFEHAAVDGPVDDWFVAKVKLKFRWLLAPLLSGIVQAKKKACAMDYSAASMNNT